MAATIDSAALQKTQRGRGQGVRDGEAVEKHWVYLEPQASTSGSCGLEALALRCLTAATLIAQTRSPHPVKLTSVHYVASRWF